MENTPPPHEQQPQDWEHSTGSPTENWSPQDPSFSSYLERNHPSLVTIIRSNSNLLTWVGFLEIHHGCEQRNQQNEDPKTFNRLVGEIAVYKDEVLRGTPDLAQTVREIEEAFENFKSLRVTEFLSPAIVTFIESLEGKNPTP